MKNYFIWCLFLHAVGITLVTGLIHDLTIDSDSRNTFFIENFGFEGNGELHMQIFNFKINGQPFTEKDESDVAFLIKRSETDSTAFIEEKPQSGADGECLVGWMSVTQPGDDIVRINTSENGQYTEFFQSNPSRVRRILQHLLYQLPWSACIV